MKYILHVGPDLSSQGGIAAVLNSYASHSSLFEESGYRLCFAGSCGHGGLGQIKQFISAWTRVAEGVLYGKFDIVHIHTSIKGSLFRKWLIAITCLILGAKYIVHIHSGAMAKYIGQSSRLKRVAIWFMFSRASQVVCLSHEMHRWAIGYTKFKPEKCALVYNGMHDPVMEGTRRYDKKEEVNIVYLGKFSAEKGTPILIEALDLLRRSGCKFKLLIAGNGDVQSTLDSVKKCELSDSVEYLGWISGSAKENLLSRADVFVLPSKSEGFPVSLVEAMAYGIAVVSTDIPGVTDAIIKEVDGILIKFGDALGLSEALKRLIENPDLRRKFGDSARKKFLGNFLISKSIRDLTFVYDQNF
jgi:glycosyltransferase involved in cell wall biosynthesis